MVKAWQCILLTESHRHIIVYTEVIILLESSVSCILFLFFTTNYDTQFLKMDNTVHLFVTFTNIKHIAVPISVGNLTFHISASCYR